VSNLSLTAFAAALVPVSGFVADIRWMDGEPVDVLLNADAWELSGQDKPFENTLNTLFDQLDAWDICYGFIVENTHDA